MEDPEEKRPGSIAASLRKNSSGVRLRLFAYTVLLLLLVLAVTIFTVRLILLERHDEWIGEELSQEVREFRNLAAADDRRTGRPYSDDPEEMFRTFFHRNVLAPEERLLAFVDGRPFLGKTPGSWIDGGTLKGMSPELAAAVREPKTIHSGTTQGRSGEVRYKVVPVRSNGELRGSFVVGYVVGPGRKTIDDAIRTSALIGLLAIGLGGLIAYMAAGRVLHPLRELTETARSIEDSDLTRRITVTGHDELSELGTTFNAMLDRLETAFDSQRDLIRNFSHELRTPITIVRGHLELLAMDPADQPATIALVTDELDRMSLLVEDLLTLAKAERSDFIQTERVPIYPFLDELLEKARPLVDRSWKLRVDGDPGEAMIDRRRMTQAMLDLIDNAVRHTDPGQKVEIGASRDRSGLHLWVDDEGPGVDPAERARIFGRFERGRTGSRYPGSGLGLAIVKVIAEAHGGRVSIVESNLGGARFEIVVPCGSAPVDPPQNGPPG